jgi:hypothetical protein
LTLNPGALVPLNATAVVPEKDMPVIVTVVPGLVPTFGLPAVGAKLSITGAPMTRKLAFEVPSPLSLTTVIGPVVAPLGTSTTATIVRVTAAARPSLVRVLRTGKGAKAPSTNVGEQEWTVKERSTPKAALKPIPRQPVVTVLSADGSGSLLRATGPVTAGSGGNTVVFVYQAAPGGLEDGALTLSVPNGWSGPSTGSHDAGYTTATAGSVGANGRTITLSHVYLSSGATLTIIYGSRAGGGPGAQAPKGKLGPTVWHASEQSTPSGTLKPLK